MFLRVPFPAPPPALVCPSPRPFGAGMAMPCLKAHLNRWNGSPLSIGPQREPLRLARTKSPLTEAPAGISVSVHFRKSDASNQQASRPCCAPAFGEEQTKIRCELGPPCPRLKTNRTSSSSSKDPLQMVSCACQYASVLISTLFL